MLYTSAIEDVNISTPQGFETGIEIRVGHVDIVAKLAKHRCRCQPIIGQDVIPVSPAKSRRDIT